MAWRYACVFFQNPEIIIYYFFCIFNLDIFWVLILQKLIGSRYLVPVTPTIVLSQSFWNFTGWSEDMHVVFFQNPEIIFYYFLHILNLDIFWVIILQKSIGSRYLVPLTPPRRSFWNFTWAFKMAWKYACGFFQNPEIIFITFSAFYLDIFWVLILQKCIGSRYLVPLILPQFLADSFETLNRLLGWPEDMHVFFENPVIIFYYFFRIFNLDIFWVLILQKRIGSRYIVPVTPTTVFTDPFETLQVF